MTRRSTIAGLAGSLRSGSFNRSLLRAAAELAPLGTLVDELSIAGVPLYDGDVERDQGVPPAVRELKERIAIADALLLVTPEYNHGIPGVFKNAIDWLSRPASDIPRVFHEKPVCVIGASSGPGGTRVAQAAWLPVLRRLGTTPWATRQLYVTNAAKVFDADGRLVDEQVRKQLAEVMTGFSAFVVRTGNRQE